MGLKSRLNSGVSTRGWAASRSSDASQQTSTVSSAANRPAQIESPALSAGERGIVLGPPVIVDERGGFTTSSYPAEQIQSALLFWDHIDYPSNFIIENENQDLDALVAMGAVRRSRMPVRSGSAGGILLQGTADILEALNAQSPGRWSLWRHAGFEGVVEPTGLDAHAASMALTNSIALPPINHPFEDILEFRLRRAAELRALREEIDAMAEAISLAPDGQRALAVRLDKLDRALSDQIRVSNEHFKITELVSLSPTFSISDAAKDGVSVTMAALVAGLPLTAALTTGVLRGAVSGIGLDLVKGKKTQATTPFDYVVSISRDLA